ncbi:hypothetical protein AYO44_02385 [Planctomycetaceae bacterium SCGC AG-212-F19]|nr:hypothetical protein AYO44_02385 [Planctomycetaceae bacterium SCGC AG-212-F19]
MIQLPAVENALIDFWMAATDADAISAASNQIDNLLRFAPDSVGDDYGDHREFTVPPLRVAYTFSRDDCQVIVTDIELVE